MGRRYFDVDVTLTVANNTVVRTEGPGGVEYRVAGKMRGVHKVLLPLQSLWRWPL